MTRSSETGGGAILIVFLMFVILGFLVGAALWPYTINTWLVYAGKEPSIEWWTGGLMGLVPGLGQVCIFGAFGTWIAMLFLR